MLVDGLDRRGLALDLDLGRVIQMAIGDLLDDRRHRGRKQGGLPGVGRMFQNPLDIIDEAHAQHFVGFIQNQGLQVFEIQGFAADVIHDSPGGADDDVDATRQLPQLLAHALAAVDGQDVEAFHVTGVGLKGFSDLNGQFAGRRQNQGLRDTPGNVDATEDGQGKGSGLAGARLGLAQQVAAGQDMRNAGGLDGGGRLVAYLPHGFQQGG